MVAAIPALGGARRLTRAELSRESIAPDLDVNVGAADRDSGVIGVGLREVGFVIVLPGLCRGSSPEGAMILSGGATICRGLSSLNVSTWQDRFSS